MSLAHKAILGLSLGTSHIGVAVISNDRLIHWQVRKFKGPWNPTRPEQLLEFIMGIVGKYEVREIAVKLPTKAHFSKRLIHIVADLGMYAAFSHLCIQSYRIHDLKQSLGERSLNKRHLMKIACERFPVLERTYQKELANKKPYHVKMFEAIIAALCMQSEQNREVSSDIIKSIFHN